MICREEPPQPAIAHSKTVEAIIRNWALYPAKIDCMTTGTVSSVGLIGATCSLAIRFDGIKPFFASWLLHPHRSWRSAKVSIYWCLRLIRRETETFERTRLAGCRITSADMSDQLITRNSRRDRRTPASSQK